MRRRLEIYVFSAAFCVMSFASPARAQDSGNDDNELTIGVGAAAIPTYDGSDDHVVTPGAIVRGKISGYSFFTRGTSLYLDVIRKRESSSSGVDVSFGPLATVRLTRTRSIKDPQVNALGKLDTAVEVGGWGEIGKTGIFTGGYDSLSFRVAYGHDVTGVHKSYLIKPSLEYGAPLSPTTFVGVSLSADYVGKGFGHYYYDVDLAGSQASGLGVYGAAGDRAGFAKLSLGIVGAKSLSGDLRKGWAVFALGGYGRLLGRYADSPLVKDAGNRNQWLGGLGVAYTF